MATSRKTAAKLPAKLACITIDHRDYLLPADKALKVVDLMQDAIECDRVYQREGFQFEYHLRDSVDVEMRMVKHSQVVTAKPAAPLLLEGPGHDTSR